MYKLLTFSRSLSIELDEGDKCTTSASCRMVDWVGAREVGPEVGASEAGEIGEIFLIPTDVELLLNHCCFPLHLA